MYSKIQNLNIYYKLYDLKYISGLCKVKIYIELRNLDYIIQKFGICN